MSPRSHPPPPSAASRSRWPRCPQGMGRAQREDGHRAASRSPPSGSSRTMPVEGNTQPYGLLHGGASVVLAETLGSIGSALHAWPGQARRGRRHQRHPPPRRHGRARSPGSPPRCISGRTMATLRGRGHRRARPAGVHLADHLRPGRRGAGRRRTSGMTCGLQPGSPHRCRDRGCAASDGRRAPAPMLAAAGGAEGRSLRGQPGPQARRGRRPAAPPGGPGRVGP